MKTFHAVLCACLVPMAAGPARAQDSGVPFKVGVITRRLAPPEPYQWRGAKTHLLVTTIWYPAEPAAVVQPQWIGDADSPLFDLGGAAPDATLASTPTRFPLVVLSHGTGGSSLMLAWLGTALAAHGYVAAAVNHPGNNALEEYAAEGFLIWWERARDLSVVIDRVTAEAPFAGRIDTGRIGAAGFSLGGYTMIEIAGGTTDPARFRDFCRARPDAWVDPDEFPGLFARWDHMAQADAGFQAAVREAGRSYRDPRVRAVLAIAPALAPAFTPESLRRVTIPVEIVAGADDPVLPVEMNAKVFASRIRGAKLTLFPGGVGHYTFLATCTDRGRAALPALCRERNGVDRDAIHRQTAEIALRFFAARLK